MFINLLAVFGMVLFILYVLAENMSLDCFGSERGRILHGVANAVLSGFFIIYIGLAVFFAIK